MFASTFQLEKGFVRSDYFLVPGLKAPESFDRATVLKVESQLLRSIGGLVEAVSSCATVCLEPLKLGFRKLIDHYHVSTVPYMTSTREMYMYLVDSLIIEKLLPSIDVNCQEIQDQINTQKSQISHLVGGGGAWKRAKRALLSKFNLNRHKSDEEVMAEQEATSHNISPFYIFASLECATFNSELAHTILVLQQFREWGNDGDQLQVITESLEMLHAGVLPPIFVTHHQDRLRQSPIPIQSFVHGWANHYWDLWRWLVEGTPCSGIELGSVHNPEGTKILFMQPLAFSLLIPSCAFFSLLSKGLLHALREDFAFKKKLKLEEVHLTAHFCASGHISETPDSITFTGLVLRNAVWVPKNQCIETLASTSEGDCNPGLVLTASAQEPEHLASRYLCPVYIHPSLHTCIGQPTSMHGASRQDTRDGRLLTHVSVNVQEGVDVAVFSQYNVFVQVKQSGDSC